MYWRLAVLGSPISHSLSPRLFEAALSYLELEGSVEAIDVNVDGLNRVHDLFRTHDAVSVTMPLKEAITGRCDRLDATARRVGVVNSVRIRDGHVLGRLTDGIGFLDAVESDFEFDVEGKHVVVRGSGGSAKALIDSFDQAGVASISLYARNLASAAAIAEKYSTVTANPSTLAPVDLVVNTIPFDAKKKVKLPEPVYSFCADAVAVDVIYDPVETPWLAAQREIGLRTSNGLSMLVHQARHQYEWWFESSVALEPLFRAVGR